MGRALGNNLDQPKGISGGEGGVGGNRAEP